MSISTLRRPRSVDLFITLVERQLRLLTKRSWISSIYPVIAPGFLLALYVFVFRRVFNVPIERYPEYLFAGLLPWIFLSQTLGKTISSLSLEADLIRRAPFRYELIPLSVVAANAVHFLITLAIFIGYLGAVGRLHLQLLPLLILPIGSVILLVMSLAMLISLIDVYNRDLRFVLGNILLIWFFLVPIVYRPNMAPDALLTLRSIDPMNMIVGQMRGILYYGNIVRPEHVFLMVAVCSALFLITRSLFRHFADDLPKDV